MEITLVGMVTIALTVICLFTPRHLVLLLSATAPFMRTAAITVEGNGFPPFYLVASAALMIAVVGWLRGVRVGLPVSRLLGAFWIVAVLVTAMSPTIFAGTLVLDPRAGIDDAVAAPTPLAYSTSVLAQVIYLTLACGTVWFIAQRPVLSSGVVTPAIAIGTLLSAARLLPGGPEILDPIFRSYGSSTFAFQTRHFGIFFEPSYLAAFSVAAIAYCAYRVTVVKGVRRLGIVIVGATAILNVSLSGTGTAAAATVILVGLAIVAYGHAFLFRRMKIPPVAMLLPLGLAFILIAPNPIRDSIVETITGKVSTSSFSARTSSNEFSIDVLYNTLGLGSGLGTNRPSSFAALVVSTTGVLGFILLAVFFWKVFARTFKLHEWRPVAAALVALLAAKVVAEPDLTTPLLWLLCGVALYVIKVNPPDELEPETWATRRNKRQVAASG